MLIQDLSCSFIGVVVEVIHPEWLHCQSADNGSMRHKANSPERPFVLLNSQVMSHLSAASGPHPSSLPFGAGRTPFFTPFFAPLSELF